MLASWERTLLGSLPASALVRRLGGDEYGVALPGSTTENALILLEEIRTHLAAHPADQLGEPIRATFGVASRPPHATETSELLACATGPTEASLLREALQDLFDKHPEP